MIITIEIFPRYETRRQLYGSLTLGTTVSSVNHWCWSLFRDTDYHTRWPLELSTILRETLTIFS